MEFKKVGAAYQLVINNGNDLADALGLDDALWVAMSAPVNAYTCDPKVLGYIDAVKLGSITTESVKEAIKWLLDVYADREAINDSFDGKLYLDKLTDSDTAGQIRHSAEYILNDLAIQERSYITLDQVREFQKILTSRPLNGDGVISLLACGEASSPELTAALRAFIEDGVKATGGSTDLDGTQGLTLPQFKDFLAAIPEYLAWLKAGELPEGASTSEILPFGGETADNFALIQANAGLVDEFFKLCDLQDFDTRFCGKVLENDGKPGSVDPASWPGVESHLKAMPIVQPAGRAAILTDAPEFINPLYRGWWCEVVKRIVLPVLGADAKEVTPEMWGKVKAVFSGYKAYVDSRKGGICAGIDPARLEGHLKVKGLLEEASALERKDLAVAEILKEAGNVEQAILYLKWLVQIANNFISFPGLYKRKESTTLFERGRIVIDGRWFNLTFPVDDLETHSAFAANSGLFLIYVEVDTNPVQTLCAPVTIGDKGNLVAGKRGIFFAPDGLTFNAKVVKVIENPVCLKEAVLAPFAKFGKMAEDKVAAMSTSSEGVITGKMAGFINDPKATAAATTAAVPAAKGDKAGMFMGLGIAFAALSSALAFICKTLADMSGLAILISLLCVAAALVAPIVMLALLRLRRQDLSSLLEGNGWAINARMRLSHKQRRAFSRGGRFPANAHGTPRKRFLNAVAWILLLVVLALGGYFGCRAWKNHKAAKAAIAEQEAAILEAQEAVKAAKDARMPADTPAECNPAETPVAPEETPAE